LENSTNFLANVPIFSDLDQETLEKIVKSGVLQSFKKNSVILSEEDSGSALFVITEGKVKVFRSSNDEKEVILAMLNESDFFGEMALLDGMARSATVMAIEDSKLFIIQRTEFLDLLKKYPEVSIALLTELTKRFRSSSMKIKALSLKDAEGKVATVLLQLADDIGKIRQGIVEIDDLPFQQELANMAGTSRETISRTLHSFAKKGLIELDGSKLKIIDYEKFKEMFN
jgi:CRP/FNR family cyclic AMP-dependent transcriptional regulator